MPRDANSDPGFWLALLQLGLQSDTDGTPLRTARETVSNGQAPGKHRQPGWGLRRGQSDSALIVTGPEEATGMAGFQRTLQGLTQADPALPIGAHHFLPGKQLAARSRASQLTLSPSGDTDL